MYIFDLKKSNVLDFSFSLSEGLCVTKDSEQKKLPFCSLPSVENCLIKQGRIVSETQC